MNKVFVVFLLVLALVATGFALSRPTSVTNFASQSGGVGQVTLTPASDTLYVGESLVSVLKFKTGTTSSDAKAISGLAVKFSYPYSGTVPQLDVQSVVLNPTLLTNPKWSFPVNSVTRANGRVTVELAAVYNDTAGFTSTSEVQLATINFKANAPATSNPITIGFDTSSSEMHTKAEPITDILSHPASVFYTVLADTTGPSAVTNLTASGTTTNSVNLTWTAPSDGGPLGKASQYDLRYSTTPITASNFTSASAFASEPTPKAAGQTETVTIGGLSANTTYYFAIKSIDQANNVSNISNVEDAKTVNPNSTLNFGYKLQAINNPSLPTGYTNSVSVRIVGAPGTSNFDNIAVTPGTNAVFRPNSVVSLGNVNNQSGGTNYEVYLKDATHLRKRMGTLLINAGANTAPSSWDTVVLKAGDFDNNNAINGADIGAILSKYTALQVPTNSTNRIYDVDQNGVINLLDISHVLSNYTALSVPGD